MEAFQDGGQQNMKSEQDYPPPTEGSRMNSEMNSYPHSSGEGTVGSESFSKMSEGMHSNQMQNYPSYNRGNYGMGDQHHSGMMAGNVDYSSQNTQFSGQFPHNPMRPSYPGMPKSGMSPVRAGLMPPGMGMMPGSYSSTQRMLSSQSMSQSQSGPTPTLNQLLQTSSSGQRFPGNYGDFSSQSKGGDLTSGASYPVPQQGWNGNPRTMGSYPQAPISGTPYRSQGSNMSENRHPSGMSPGQGPSPGYPHQGQYMNSAMAANAQRYMMSQVRPGHMPPMSSHGYNQQLPPHSGNYSPSMPNQPSQPPSVQQQQQQQQLYHGQQQQGQPPGQQAPLSQPSPTPSQQQPAASSSLRPPSSLSQGSSPKQASPALPGSSEQISNHGAAASSTSSKKPEETESAKENSHGEDQKEQNSSEASPSGGGPQPQLGVSGARFVPSPAGSTGSRSDTPGAQVGSPMPPRPPSSQVEGQNHTSHSPMATQAGYNQQMMPPPMPGQMGYPGATGGKMSGPGMGGTQMPPHFPQYGSQYSQGGFRNQQGMGGMQGAAASGAIPGSGYPQAMYNGPSSQMGPGGPGMYNNMMGRSLQNYNPPYGPGSSMPMNSHYGSFNSHMGPGQGPGPGPGPGPGSGPGPGQTSAGSVPMGPGQMMGQAGMNSGMGMSHGPSMMPGGKGAQAAAQAALMAAANSAGTRMPGRGMSGSPRMMGPQGSGSPSPGVMNHMVGNLGNPSLAGMSNQIQQITSSSVTASSKPSSPAGSAPFPTSSSNTTPTPTDNSGPSNSMGGHHGVGIGSNGGCGGEPTNLMSPLSGSDTQESSSRPSSTATPGQTADTANSASDIVGSDGSGSMPSSDSTSVDSGFHSAADHSEKPPCESTPTHSSSPSSSFPPPSSNGQCEEEASQESVGKEMSGASTPIPTSIHTSTTTTTITKASVGMTVTASLTTSGSSGTQSAGSQTSTSVPMMMNTSSNSSPANSTANGPHNPHPHPSMGYLMGPHGPGPVGNSHMMAGQGSHHPGMQPMGNMSPYNMPSAGSMGPGNMPPSGMSPNMPAGNMPNSMPPGNMPSSMPPGNMPNSMPPGNMPNSMPPGNMPPGNMSSNMPPGNMPNSMPLGNMPSNMHPGNMPNNMAGGNIMNSMGRGGMPNHMPPSSMAGGAVANSIAPGVVPNHLAPGGMAGTGSMRNTMGDINSHAVGPASMLPQKNSAPPVPSLPEEQPEKKKKKASDVTRLYDMGSERDRRPFLDRLFAFLEDKGTPLATMPTISKQPLDLFTLYHCVREKGGMVEVNKAKRWKEICSVVNIGTSASAAFTLKKNYIRYLFAFECKFDHGGLDPTPILQEIEAQQERKRESKKRVPSPGSQSSQDTFQQPPTPNSQMMEGYPGGPGMPPPYMQGPDGQMIPAGMGGHGPGMMMANNMMGHPNMMPPHPGSGPGMMGHGPGGMMMSSGMPPNTGQNMMAGNMGPQAGMMNAGGSMMGPGGMMGPGMHMGPNSYGTGPPNSMMGPGPSNSSSSSMGPSPGPPMMTGSSSSGTNTTPSSLPNGSSAGPPSSSIALPPSSTPNSRPNTADSVSVQDPFADEPSKASSPATFQSRVSGPTPSPTPGGFPSPGPPTTSTASGFGSRPSSTSNPNASAFPGSPASEPTSFRRSADSFQSNSSGAFPIRSDSAPFPFSHESSSHPGQPYRPTTGSSESGFTPRFPGQQPPFPAGETFNNAHPFPGHGPSLGPRMSGQDGFSGFPSPQHSGGRPPMSREGSFSGPGGCMSQYSEWNGAGGMGQSPYPSHLEPFGDYNMSGREGAQWSAMHAQRSFPPSSGAPGTPMGPFGRPPQRGSPQTREKVLTKLQQKGGAMLPNSPFPPKKEIVFPADSVEAVEPSLNKRRRVTHKDLAPVEAWRLMMALKSGMLAESTWAIDTLNVLLFDDVTVTYFNLSNMPGLLEVLTEHFRAALIHTFDILRDRELQGKKSSNCFQQAKEGGEEESDKENGDHLATLIETESEASVDCRLYCSNYTWVSRQGKTVVKEEHSADSAVMDAKHWDLFSNFTSGKQHWQKGGGDITHHVVPCLESGVTHRLLTRLFYPTRTDRKEGDKEGGHKRKAASCSEDGCSHCHGGSERLCSKKCGHTKRVKEASVTEKVWGSGGLVDKHSNQCSVKGHRNNFVSKVGIKEELREPELRRCESDDSLPPPVLPAATQDCPVSSEDREGTSSDPLSQSVDMEEKPAPPDLTREELDGDENRVKKEVPSPSAEKDTHVQKTNSNLEGPAPPGSDDQMTAEIVAMMIKEQDEEIEEEAYRHDDAPLTVVQSDQEEMGRRCVALSNIFRSLSCIPGNESLLSKHHGFMTVVGHLLLLHHWHPPRSKAQPAPPLISQDDEPAVEDKKVTVVETEAVEERSEGEKDWATSPEWWWDILESIRENMLVVLANVCSHMHMRNMDNDVCLPILDGLLHWMVCPSSTACDPLPSATASQLSPQRLVLEALCKLCIHDDNVDLLLATPPFSRILLLLGRLMRLLSERTQLVPREFSIVLLSRLVQADSVAARAIALQHPAISLLLDFLESAEQSVMAVASQRGPVSSNNPEVMGTSLDMLRRAASTLLHMARVPDNRKLFLHHQSRLLALVMSQVLDAGVTQIISDVLFECSQSDLPLT